MGDEDQWPMVPRAMSVPPEREEMCVPPDRATTMSVPLERAVAAAMNVLPRERASSLTVPSTSTMDVQDRDSPSLMDSTAVDEPSETEQERDKDWWKTPYAGVSWTFQSSIVGPLLPSAVGTCLPATPAIDLNPALPGVRGALDTLSRYEADVGFHFSTSSSPSSYPYPPSYVYTPPSPSPSPSPQRHTTLLHAFFDGIPSPHASSPVSSPSSSSSSSSTSSASPPRTPTTPAPLNPAARTFVSVRVRRDAQGWLVGVDELPFQPFEGDETPGRIFGSSDSDEGDPFVVRPPKTPRRRKDMLDVLARRGTPSPGMRKPGWIDVGPGWVDVSSPAVDLSPSRRSAQKQKQPRGGRRRRQQPQPQVHPQPPQQQYGKLVGRDWR